MKTFIGKVKSAKMTKTIVVEVENKTTHPLYQKPVRKNNSFKVHNQKLALKAGDLVKFKETKPISKEKKWIVIEKL